MADFADQLGLTSLLKGWGVDPAKNFEDTYSDLFEAGEHDKLRELNALVEGYFGALELPDKPTLYDHLVLSLRNTDVIATFNWDPLLMQAYLRTPRRIGRPKLAFLHGNLRAGYCEEDDVQGLFGAACSHCGNPFKRTDLLYPVRHKNYADDPAIASQWELLKWALKGAFMITIFGYSGPKTDAEAIAAMSEAWGSPDDRRMEQTAFITLQDEDEVRDAWSDFILSHHYEVQSNFYESWLAKHPRRTGEAYLSQYLDAQFIDDHPLPQSATFNELHAWLEPLFAVEREKAERSR